MTRRPLGLQAQVALRAALVAVSCLAVATIWVVRDTADELKRDAELSADRVTALLASPAYVGTISLSMGGVAPSPVFFDWQDHPATFLVAPGVCVEFGQDEATSRRRCGAWDPATPQPPAWFGRVFASFLESEPPQRRILHRGIDYGSVTAHLDPAAAIGRAWSRVRVLFGIALAMTVAMGALTALVIGRTLAPVRRIADGLRTLGTGDFRARLPRFRTREFDRLSSAYNDMAEALERGRAERQALTRRLIEVQESERRMIARELHDEFGQCLTATRALAASIERRAGGSDLAEDARAISEISGGMMGSLRSALFHLRPPELDELGLEQALIRLANGWSARKPGTRVAVKVTGDCGALDDENSLSLYRIVQECITNAMRHGEPTRVEVDLAAPAGGPVVLTVTDDGGGALPEGFEGGGLGLVGIRERVSTLGGSFEIGAAGRGVRVAVTLPGPAKPLPPPAEENSSHREIFPGYAGKPSLAAP